MFLRVTILVVMFGYFCFQVFTTWLGVKNGLYSSDGFHYWSFLRNASSGLGWYEGPTFQYLFGNHAYLTLLLLAPLTLLGLGPSVLGITSVTLHFLSALLVFLISRGFNQGTTSALALSFLFLGMPYVLATSLGTTYLFQPDFLAAPLALLLFFAGQSRKPVLFMVAMVALIGVKEEWILWAPLFILFSALVLQINPFRAKRRWALTFCYLAISSISFITLYAFRSLNTYSHVPLISSLGINLDLDFGSILSQIFFWAPVLLVLLIGVALKPTRWRIASLFAIVAVVAARSVVNQVIYEGSPPPWGPHALLTPVMAIAMVYGFRNISEAMTKKSNSSLVVAATCISFLAVMGFSWSGLSSLQRQLDQASSAISLEMRGVSKEFSRLGDEAGYLHDEGGYFIAQEFLMHEFMSSSHISASWLVHQVNQDELLQNATFAIVSAENHSLSDKLIDAGFVRCSSSFDIGAILYCRR